MKTILVIEDNDEIRENTAEILELSNYKVYTAPNGKEGVALASDKKPDLIVCDIMMPVLDGYGVLHMINKIPELQTIPFIFITAKAERAEIRKGMELGADDYLTKPFSSTELLNAVEGRLKRSDFLKERFSNNLEGFDYLVKSVSGKDALKTLTEDRTENTYKKKQIVYSEGNHPLRLYFVKTGKVKTYKINDDGKELITSLYSTGDFLGYVALLEGKDYKETAEALEETELVIIPRQEFDDLLNSNPAVTRKFVSLLANNITEKEDQLLSLAYNSLRKKVADALMVLSKKYNPDNDPSFVIDMSRENLANIAGTAKESLIRTLSDFKDEKLIDIQQGNVLILNKKKIENMAN